MGHIVDNAHILATERADLRVLIVRRKPTRPATPAELVTAYQQALELPRQRYAGWGLVVDTRDAPGRNDRAFEDAMNTLRLQASRAFPRVAVLVASAIGVLQSQRLREESGAIGLITRDEAEALAFAAGARGSSGGPRA